MQAKIILSGLFLCFLCSPVLHAEYDISDLGKLFTDKSQRTQIDATRSGKSSKDEAKQVDKVKVSGYMKRSDGKNVVWVNGESTIEESKVDNVKVYPQNINDSNKKVPVKVDDQKIYLKPGESWSKSTGKVSDNN